MYAASGMCSSKLYNILAEYLLPSVQVVLKLLLPVNASSGICLPFSLSPLLTNSLQWASPTMSVICTVITRKVHRQTTIYQVSRCVRRLRQVQLLIILSVQTPPGLLSYQANTYGFFEVPPVICIAGCSPTITIVSYHIVYDV